MLTSKDVRYGTHYRIVRIDLQILLLAGWLTGHAFRCLTEFAVLALLHGKKHHPACQSKLANRVGAIHKVIIVVLGRVPLVPE
jgi:hypothetical protein